MLDISAGWGDRLLTAMACDMDYLGFDPNIDLEAGHSAMINLFGHPSHHQVIYEPFEDSHIPPNSFHVIGPMSPPFYDREIYSNDKNQSINRYPNFNTWLVQFLFISLRKAWNCLKLDGYFIIHMGDTHEIRICEAMNLFIEEYLPYSSYEGIISVVGETNIHRPVWIWKKSTYRQRRWNPKVERSLLSRYPELASEIEKYLLKVKQAL
jgi:hypothetical protein